jgi:hypothetical protein
MAPGIAPSLKQEPVFLRLASHPCPLNAPSIGTKQKMRHLGVVLLFVVITAIIAKKVEMLNLQCFKCGTFQPIKRQTRDPIVAQNQRNVVNELNDKFRGLRQGCFPMPKGESTNRLKQYICTCADVNTLSAAQLQYIKLA